MRIAAHLMFMLTAVAGCGRGQPLPLLDAGGASPDVTSVSPESCYRGVAFAQCPGPQQPASYCAGKEGGLPGSAGCLWISNGAPLAQYNVKLTKSCTCKQCDERHRMSMWIFLISHGTAPWTRSREMNAVVMIDKAVTSGTASLSCSTCKAGTCRPAWSPCNDSMGFAQRSLPGTFVVHYFSSVMMGGWYLMVEMDIRASPMKGRICRMPYTDAIGCKPGKPVCAISGDVLISDAPVDSNLKGIAGWFKAKFPDGMSVTGAF